MVVPKRGKEKERRSGSVKFEEGKILPFRIIMAWSGADWTMIWRCYSFLVPRIKILVMTFQNIFETYIHLRGKRLQQTLAECRLLDRLPNKYEFSFLAFTRLRCFNFIRVVDVAYTLDKEHAAICNRDTCF
jgi:hypothetical protein